MEKPPRPPGPPSRVFTPFGRERDVFGERKGKEQNFFYPFLISVVVEEKEKKSWMTNARAQHNLHTGRTGRQNNFWCQCASSAQAEFFPGPTSRLNGLGQAQGYTSIHTYVQGRGRGSPVLLLSALEPGDVPDEDPSHHPSPSLANPSHPGQLPEVFFWGARTEYPGRWRDRDPMIHK